MPRYCAVDRRQRPVPVQADASRWRKAAPLRDSRVPQSLARIVQQRWPTWPHPANTDGQQQANKRIAFVKKLLCAAALCAASLVPSLGKTFQLLP